MNSTATLTAAPPVIPSFPTRSPLGVLPELQRNPLEMMERAAFEHGPVVRMPVPTVQAFALAHPKAAEHVLVTNVKNYTKQTRGYDMLRLVLGNGLVTSEGTFWKRQRRIAQPAFHRERMSSFAQSMTRAASEMVDGWAPGQPIDVAHEFMRCTLRVVGETLLSTDVTSEADTVGPALTTLLEHLIHRTTHPLSLPEWVPTPANQEFNRALERLDAVVLDVIARRRAGNGPDGDLLAMLMNMKDPETGEGMDDAQLRDEVMTIFLAGHETTANLLSWTTVLLGRAPGVERKLLEELAPFGGRPPGFADVPQLTYSSMVLKESMRLFPPVWTLGRLVQADDEVMGYHLPKGALVFVSPWVIHRLPEFWKDPQAFDPERWAEEDPRRARGSYLPFSMGQRKCIGDSFAMMEGQLILSTVLQRVHLSLLPGQTFEPEPVITLRPKGGVRVIATRR